MISQKGEDQWNRAAADGQAEPECGRDRRVFSRLASGSKLGYELCDDLARHQCERVGQEARDNGKDPILVRPQSPLLSIGVVTKPENDRKTPCAIGLEEHS